MKKVTLKAIRYEMVNGQQTCVGDIVFAGTKEIAGTRKGFAGDWTVTNLNGETKHFTTEKAIREWLGSQEETKKEEEMSIKEWVEKFGKSFTVTKEEMGLA